MEGRGDPGRPSNLWPRSDPKSAHRTADTDRPFEPTIGLEATEPEWGDLFFWGTMTTYIPSRVASPPYVPFGDRGPYIYKARVNNKAFES